MASEFLLAESAYSLNMNYPTALAVLAGMVLVGGGQFVCASQFHVNSAEDAWSGCDCGSSIGKCTLRAAIRTANALAGAHSITVPQGLYTLSNLGDGEDDAATGDLDIKCDLTITGAGAGKTIVDGGGRDRVFQVFSGCTVEISGLTVRKGSADRGGGLCNHGTLTLNGCIVSNNIATDDSEGGGGIFSANSSSLTLISSTVCGNVAANGGGVLNRGDAKILYCIVSSNAAATGGGIYCAGVPGTLSLNCSTVSSNKATSHGGGIHTQGTLAVDSCTLSANNGGGSGGAIYNGGCPAAASPDSVASLTNSTISGNSAGDGGAIWNAGGTLTLDNCTVCASQGDGVSNNNAEGGGPVNVKNTVVANNKPRDCRGAITSFGHNLFSDDSAGSVSLGDLISTDPLLGPLACHGGSTMTHALEEKSPAIDHVPSNQCTVSTDQRSAPRPQLQACDTGAYEADPGGWIHYETDLRYVLLRWGATNWNLLSSANLQGPWLPFPIPPTTNEATIPFALDTNRFFRLAR